MARKIQFRRGTAASWTSTDPTLAIGELGLETDTGKIKIGDGVTAWSARPYIDAAALAHIADTSAAHAAASIASTPAGTLAATDVQAALNELDTEKAPLASPALTGTPTAPTAATATNTTQVATTAFVRANRAEQAAADISQYGISAIWLPGEQFQVALGSPTIRPAAYINSMTLDPGSIESVTHAFRTHPSWTTATVTMWYYTLAATGNFLVYSTVYLAGTGESVSPSAETGLTSPATVAPASVGIITAHQFGTFTCQPAKTGQITIMREGSAAGDTNAGDLCMIGVSIAKAS